MLRNLESSFGIVITDALLAELDKVFSPKMVETIDNWDDLNILKGNLQVIRWLKQKQQEVKGQLHGEADVSINSS